MHMKMDVDGAKSRVPWLRVVDTWTVWYIYMKIDADGMKERVLRRRWVDTWIV